MFFRRYNEIDKMLEDKFIEFSDSLWVVNVCLVKKKDGINRFCIDFRKLNFIICKDVYLFFCIDEILDILIG